MTFIKWVIFVALSLFFVCAAAKPPPHDHAAAAPPPPPASPYGRIHIDLGHDQPKIDVDCGAQTPIKACADVASSLLKQAVGPPGPGPGMGKPKPPKP